MRETVTRRDGVGARGRCLSDAKHSHVLTSCVHGKVLSAVEKSMSLSIRVQAPSSQFTLSIPLTSTIGVLKDEISKNTGLPPNELVILANFPPTPVTSGDEASASETLGGNGARVLVRHTGGAPSGGGGGRKRKPQQIQRLREGEPAPRDAAAEAAAPPRPAPPAAAHGEEDPDDEDEADDEPHRAP